MRLLILAGALLTGCVAAPGGEAPSTDVTEETLLRRVSNTTCLAPESTGGGGGPASVSVERAFPNLSPFQQALWMTQVPGRDDFFYVVEKAGRVLRFRNDPSVRSTEVVLDIRGRVDSGPNEAGLLGFAFHPDFERNGVVFASYTLQDQGQLTTRLSRFVSSDGGRTIDPGSEVAILGFAQPFANHNGGHIAFGPEGALYLGYGDGGSAGDPLNHGQNPATPHGTLLRIRVDGPSGYTVPPDNPFVGQAGALDEVYAYGLRNPWRFSWDRTEGTLWLADVGQNRLEEVNQIVAGGNYGWNIKEGRDCFNRRSCSSAGLVDPVAQYDHSQGVSITGGFVYRGRDVPSLFGAYVYGDFVSGRIWALREQGGRFEPEVLLDSSLTLATFAEDNRGELYALDFARGTIHRFVEESSGAAGPGLPERLSETGCFNPDRPEEPVAAVVPYDVNAPLWSDGAAKERFFAIPDGTTLTRDGDDFELPPGSVTIKTFFVGGERAETRFMVRRSDGEWTGYSYAWNNAQTEAFLVPPEGQSVRRGGQVWDIPSRTACFQCHTEVAGRTLGLEIGQLNGSFRYPDGTTENQLEALDRAGFVDSSLPSPTTLVRFAGLDDADPAGDRFRSYLHSNCAHCHQPGGPGRGALDLRFSTPLGATGACNAPPEGSTLGVQNPRLIAPGAPNSSILLWRMFLREEDVEGVQMPPLATVQFDREALRTGIDWVGTLTDADCR